MCKDLDGVRDSIESEEKSSLSGIDIVVLMLIVVGGFVFVFVAFIVFLYHVLGMVNV